MRALHPDAMADLHALALRLTHGIPRLGGLLRYLVLLIPFALILPAIVMASWLFAPGPPAYRPYLPATMLNDEAAIRSAVDHSTLLSRMREPVLHGSLPDGIVARIRLLEKPSWGRPSRSVRIEVAHDGRATAVVTQLDDNGPVHCRYRRSLAPETAATIQRLTAPAMGTRLLDNVFSFDGTSWLLEMHDADGYRFLDFDSAQVRNAPILDRTVTELQRAGRFWDSPCIVQFTVSTLGF